MHISTEIIIVIVFFLFGSAVMLAGCLVWIWRLEQREKKFKTLVDFHELFENIMTEYVDYSITIGTPHDEKAERLNRAMY